MISLTGIVIFFAAFFFSALKRSFRMFSMKGMIPHHSSAMMTSKHASLNDKQVKMLADSIIQSQQSEIEIMKEFIAGEKNK